MFDEGETAERTIPEDAAGGSLVGSLVSATDSDSGDTLRYRVLATDDSPFFIDAGTGQISLASRHGLDHESLPTYTLMVTVTDSLSASDTITVTISVADVDEPPPAPAGDFSFGPDSADSPESKLALRWPESTTPEGVPSITAYDVRYRERATPELVWIELEDVPTSVTSGVPPRLRSTIPGLKSNTLYEAQVRTVNHEGSSAWVPSAPAQASTAAAQLTVAFRAEAYQVREGAAVTITVLVTPAADRDDEVEVVVVGDGLTVSGLGANGVLAIPKGSEQVAFTVEGIEDDDSDNAR